MSSLLFEQLENAGYLRGREVKVDKIAAAETKDLIDLANQSVELTAASAETRDASLFTHSAAISLGAGRVPCSSPSCRLARARGVAQFACLYSDRVYVHNFLQDFTSHAGHARTFDPDWLRRNFATDLLVLSELRPIIEAGKMMVVGFSDACPSCLAQRGLGMDVNRRLTKATRRLQRKYRNEITVDLEKAGDDYCLIGRGPSSLLDHGCQTWTLDKLPPGLASIKRLKARINSGETVRLSARSVKLSGFDFAMATDVRKSATFEFASSQSLGSSLLTERELDVEMLQSLSSDPAIARRNELLRQHLTSIVPFIDGVDPAVVLKLRNNEEDAFIQFRAAIRQAVEEVRAEKGRFTESDARELYADLVQPKLAKVDSKVRSAQRTLLRGTVGEVVTWGAAITVGMLTKLLPGDLATLVSALGLTKVAAEIGYRAWDKSDLEKEARCDDMYFLWKLKQASSK